MPHYIALIHKEAGSCYGVSFPDLPGVVAAGDTLDDALLEAGEALAFAAEGWSDHTGGSLPKPRTLEAIRSDRTMTDQLADSVVAAVPLRMPADAAG